MKKSNFYQLYLFGVVLKSHKPKLTDGSFTLSVFSFSRFKSMIYYYYYRKYISEKVKYYENL